MVHVEEFAHQLVDGVLGLELHVHCEEKGGEEEDGAPEGDQLRGGQLARLVLVRVAVTEGPALLEKSRNKNYYNMSCGKGKS